MIYVGGGQTPSMSPPVDMASVSAPVVQQPRMQFLQPSRARQFAQPLRAMQEDSTEGALARRELLSAFAFAAAAAQEASALTPVDLKDDRKVKSQGFDYIYEARDLDLDQRVRDGMVQARSSVTDTKARVVEAKKRIATEMPKLVKQAYWTQAREQLRLQVGTLRFDLKTLADQKPKSEKKAALAANKAFINAAESLDFAIREKNGATAEKALGQTISTFGAALSNVL